VLGIQEADRVVICMPMFVEGVVAMQACARIGAIHSVVLGGFSAESLPVYWEKATSRSVTRTPAASRSWIASTTC